MTFTLRPEQLEFIANISSAFRSHRRVLGVAVTGFGKTASFAEMTRRGWQRNKRVYIVVHRIEIVNQICAALRRVGVPHGRIAADRPMSGYLVQVGMIQTVANRIKLLPAPDLIVTDEAHHATAGSYRKLMEAWPDAYSLGVTATPQRTDGTGLGECYDVMVIGPSMREQIAKGYLSSFKYLAPPQQVDLSAVKSRAGDYAQDQLAAAMDQSAVTGDAIAHYAKYLNGRPAIAFCVSVAHAEHVAEQFTLAGWKAKSVDGAMDEHVRAERIASIGDGRLNVLCSCDIISEGTDIPVVAGAILLRPTQSLIVFLQQIGRVLRLKPDGSDAVILDHVGNVFRHGMPDEPREWSLVSTKKEKPPIPRVQQCPKCYAAQKPGPKCLQCDHVFAQPKPVRRAAIEQRDGELTETDGKAVAAERAASVKKLVNAALDLPYDKAKVALQQIARSQGYKPQWVFFALKDYRANRGRRAA